MQDPSVWQFLGDAIAKGGLPAAVAFCAVAIWTLWNENRALRRELGVLQEKRVEEAKAVTDRVVAITEKINDAVAKSASVVDAVTELHERTERDRGGRR
jgi:hypothetical protein